MHQDIHIHMDLSVPARTLVFFMAAMLLVILTPELGSENVTLSTYYPAPSGVYTKMVTTGNTYLATSGAMVGIGTTNPGSLLDVNGAVNVNGTVQLRGSSGGTGLYVNKSGQVGIGTTAQGGSLDVEGAGGIILNAGSIGIGNTSPTGTNTVGAGVSNAVANAAPNVGLYVGGGNNNGYLYIDNSNTGCGLALASNCATNGGCCPDSNYYATYTPGVYVEGYSYQNHGGPPVIVTGACALDPTKVGLPGQSCWSYTVEGEIPNGTAVAAYTLAQNNAPPDYVYCCPK